MDNPALNGYVLVIGSLSMMALVITIILFIYLYQKKLFRKELAYRNIEKLLQRQELKSAYSLIEGQEQERKRIASEIHDNVGNLLATIKIYSDLILKKETDPETRRLNKKINEITEAVTSEIRKISHSLDSGVVHNFGFQAAIDQLAEAVQSSGKIEFTVVREMTEPLPSETSLFLYRIIQELITNTLKHAQATKARLEVSQIDQELSVIFEDNGTGFNPGMVGKGIGLQNIRNRVNHLQGELMIQSTAQGSTFIIEIPIEK